MRKTSLLLAVLFVALVWAHAYFPSQDGPSHLYNTRIILRWHDAASVFHQYYTLDMTPVPNWLATVALGALMLALPALAAEKVLVTACILGLTFAWWYWLDGFGQRRSPLNLIGPLIATGFVLYKGFYSFCLSLPLLLLALGYAWRHRTGMTRRHVAVLYAILIPAYFAHVVSFSLALAVAIVFVVAHADRADRRFGGMPLPALLLCPLFVLVASAVAGLGSGNVSRWGAAMLARYFLRGEWLVSFSGAQIVVSTALMALLAALAIAEAVRLARGGSPDPETRPLLAAAALAGLLYVAMPRGVSGGWYLSERLAMFPVLLIAPLLGRRLTPRAAGGVALAIVALSVGQALILAGEHRRYDAALAEYTSLADRVRPGSVVLPLWWRDPDPDLRVFPLLHAAGYYGLDKDIVNLGNYAAKTSHFPVRFREDLVMPPHSLIERRPSAIDVRAYAGAIDAVITWGMRDHAPRGLVDAYEQAYDRAGENGHVMVFTRKGSAP